MFTKHVVPDRRPRGCVDHGCRAHPLSKKDRVSDALAQRKHYAGDSEIEETVYLVGAAGELNPSDELVAAVEAVLAKIAIATDNAHSGGSLEDVETDLENALERYRGRQ